MVKGVSIMTRKKAEATTDEIFVKVARTGGQVHEISLSQGQTVEEALNAADIEWDVKSRIRANGEAVELDDEVEDGDRITVSGTIKGGTI